MTKSTTKKLALNHLRRRRARRSRTRRCWTRVPTGRSSRRTSRNTRSSRGWGRWGARWPRCRWCTTSTSTEAAASYSSWLASASTPTSASGLATLSQRPCTEARRVWSASSLTSRSSKRAGNGCSNSRKYRSPWWVSTWKEEYAKG